MNTTQVSTILNNVIQQAMGEAVLQTYEAQGIVSLGNAVLSSKENTEAFCNTLVQRIGRTIISFRAYKNKLADMVMDDFEFGAILQKVKIKMPTATDDDVYDLPEDGQSLDQYIIARPKMTQKFFVTRAPYKFFVTIQRKTLQEAFLSETAMGAFISGIYGEVQNKLEVSLENMGRICLSNMIAETSISGNANQVVNLVSEYNTETGKSITTAAAWFDPDFLRYSVGRIKETMRMMTEMMTMFNSEDEERHTPLEFQRLKILSKFESRLETVVQYAAFHEDYVRLAGFQDLAFWQNSQSPSAVMIDPASGGDTVALNNIVAVLHDRDALGTYKKEEDVATTPVNARGLYYNTFWHEKQLWFNDLSENFVIFTLN